MRWRIPVLLSLSALVATSCDQNMPNDPNDSVSDAQPVLMEVQGTNRGAVRWIPDEECGVFDANGDFFQADCKNQIATFSNNGNALVTVKASGVPNETGKVVRWDADNPPPLLLLVFGLEAPPAPCVLLDTDGGLTLFTVKWSGKITPSGEASFQCHFQKKWEWVPPEGWESPF